MITVLILVAFFAQAMDQNRAPVKATPAPTKHATFPTVDHTFALAATQGGNAELDLAHLALKQSHAGGVLGYANKMIIEHEGIMKDFQPVIAKLLSSPPLERLAPQDALAFQHLQSIPAPDFDQEYVLGQIAGHLATMTVFQTEAENGTDPQLKELARKWLPTIQAHLEIAVDLTKRIGGSSPFKTN